MLLSTDGAQEQPRLSHPHRAAAGLAAPVAGLNVCVGGAAHAAVRVLLCGQAHWHRLSSPYLRGYGPLGVLQLRPWGTEMYCAPCDEGRSSYAGKLSKPGLTNDGTRHYKPRGATDTHTPLLIARGTPAQVYPTTHDQQFKRVSAAHLLPRALAPTSKCRRRGTASKPQAAAAQAFQVLNPVDCSAPFQCPSRAAPSFATRDPWGAGRPTPGMNQ